MKFSIVTNLDLIRAKQLLAQHIETLQSMKNERAIWYTNSIIGSLKEAIAGCNLIEAFNDGDIVVITINPNGKIEKGIVRKGEYRAKQGRYCYVAVAGYGYAQGEILTIKNVS